MISTGSEEGRRTTFFDLYKPVGKHARVPCVANLTKKKKGSSTLNWIGLNKLNMIYLFTM